jgi:hypothetical protein
MSSATHRYNYPLGTNPGGQDVVSLNFIQNPFTAVAVVNIVSGSSSYGIDFTVDDLDTDPTLFAWFPLPNAPAGQTASGAYPIPFPVTAIRLNFGSITGDVKFTVIQSPASTR